VTVLPVQRLSPESALSRAPKLPRVLGPPEIQGPQAALAKPEVPVSSLPSPLRSSQVGFVYPPVVALGEKVDQEVRGATAGPVAQAPTPLGAGGQFGAEAAVQVDVEGMAAKAGSVAQVAGFSSLQRLSNR